MPDRKNLCAMLPIELHNKVTAAKTVAGLSLNEYVAQILTEYFEWKERGGSLMAQENGKTRTMAFQISEELFQKLKAHLERETKRLGYKVTQRDFVIGLIEAALAEADRTAEEAAQSGETDHSGEEAQSGETDHSGEAAQSGETAHSGEAEQDGETAHGDEVEQDGETDHSGETEQSGNGEENPDAGQN